MDLCFGGENGTGSTKHGVQRRGHDGSRVLKLHFLCADVCLLVFVNDTNFIHWCFVVVSFNDCCSTSAFHHSVLPQFVGLF